MSLALFLISECDASASLPLATSSPRLAAIRFSARIARDPADRRLPSPRYQRYVQGIQSSSNPFHHSSIATHLW